MLLRQRESESEIEVVMIAEQEAYTYRQWERKGVAGWCEDRPAVGLAGDETETVGWFYAKANARRGC